MQCPRWEAEEKKEWAQLFLSHRPPQRYMTSSVSSLWFWHCRIPRSRGSPLLLWPTSADVPTPDDNWVSRTRGHARTTVKACTSAERERGECSKHGTNRWNFRSSNQESRKVVELNSGGLGDPPRLRHRHGLVRRHSACSPPYRSKSVWRAYEASLTSLGNSRTASMSCHGQRSLGRDLRWLGTIPQAVIARAPTPRQADCGL